MYSGHVTSIDQSEASIQVKWSLMGIIDQSVASIQVTWLLWTNQWPETRS